MGFGCAADRFSRSFLEKKSTVKDRLLITELKAYVQESYVTSTYKSCSSVIMSSTNGPAMDFLCGPWGSYRCTSHRWFDYMGSTENGFSPFDIKYLGNKQAWDKYVKSFLDRWYIATPDHRIYPSHVTTSSWNKLFPHFLCFFRAYGIKN